MADGGLIPYLGAWDVNTFYNRGDVVLRAGVVYQARSDRGDGRDPTGGTPYWRDMSAVVMTLVGSIDPSAGGGIPIAAGSTYQRSGTGLYVKTGSGATDWAAPGGGAGGVSVDNGTDPPAAVTTIVAAGAVIDGDSATLYPSLIPLVDGVEVRAPEGTEYPDFSVRSVDHPDDYLDAYGGSAVLVIRVTDYGNSPLLLQVPGGLGTVSAFEVGSDGSAYFRLVEAGSIFRVRDSNANAIFRIDDDGSVHIKTGTSIQADL